MPSSACAAYDGVAGGPGCPADQGIEGHPKPVRQRVTPSHFSEPCERVGKPTLFRYPSRRIRLITCCVWNVLPVAVTIPAEFNRRAISPIELESRGLTSGTGEIIRYRAVNRWDPEDEFDEWARPMAGLTSEVGGVSWPLPTSSLLAVGQVMRCWRSLLLL